MDYAEGDLRSVKALILAAGAGERLRPLTDTVPKPMLPLGDEPLLVHTIRHLRAYGVVDIAINLHHHAEVITSSLEDGARFGTHLTYSYEDPILGTAGAVRQLSSWVDSTLLVIYGDVLTDADIGAFIGVHRSQDVAMTIGLYRTEHPWDKSVVEIDGGRRVRSFVEKPARGNGSSHLTGAGLYALEPNVVQYIPVGAYYDFGFDLFPNLIGRGIPIGGYELPAYVRDIGTPEGYQRAQEDLARGVVHLKGQRQGSTLSE